MKTERMWPNHKKCEVCSATLKPLFNVGFFCPNNCDKIKKNPNLLPLDQFSWSSTYLGNHANGHPEDIMRPSTKWTLFKYLARVAYLVHETGGVPTFGGLLGGAPAFFLIALNKYDYPVPFGRDIESCFNSVSYYKNKITSTMSTGSGHIGVHKVNFASNFSLYFCDEGNAMIGATRGVGLVLWGKTNLPSHFTKTIENTRNLLTNKEHWNCLTWDVPWKTEL